MYRIYVLKSLKNRKHYVGFTEKTIEERLAQHKSGSTQWTRQNGPFELVYQEEFQDKFAAQRRERFLKSGHGREFLKSKFK
jgi:putative endonuclease